ncbi:hypothetical protein [Sporosarcina sp. P1]|uniref:hypothetical protein n=1 Tax=Sporosarcina sp. P1 TaxID=2048257 RepID=UPI00117BDC59|nr:hypothetical protein [Sporosarcina sp. P1]
MNNSIENVKTHKKFGLGSLSLLLFILGILFSVSFGKYDAIGDYILRFMSVKPWSNGNTGLHYTVFYSLAFYIPALIIGYKFKSDWGAKVGRILSTILVVSILVTLLFFEVIQIFQYSGAGYGTIFNSEHLVDLRYSRRLWEDQREP